MTKKKYFFLILILGSLTALTPFTIDMYLPGFPAIARDLQTTASKVSLSLTGFFIGILFGQLLYGPLLDKYGRKKPLYAGLTLYIIASAACAMATSIESLIAVRCIQALGGCAASVAAVAMVRDLFPITETAKVLSLLMLVVGASPMIAPTVGGYITAAFGWQYVFVILACMGVAILLACFLWLPDSYMPDKAMSLRPRAIIADFITVLKEKQFIVYALTGAVAFSGLFGYVSGSPQIFMNVFGASEKIYGWLFAFLSIGFIGSSQLNTLFLRWLSSNRLVRISLAVYVTTGILFVICAALNLLSLPLTVAFLFILLSCIGICNPNAAALCLAPFSKNAGVAAALMGALQMGLGALASGIISMYDIPSVLPLAAIMAGSAILALLVLFTGKRYLKDEKIAQPGDAVAALH